MTSRVELHPATRLRPLRRPYEAVFVVFWYLFLGCAAIVVIMPYVWMISTSLKGTEEIFTYPPAWIPREWRFHNYLDAWNSAPFGRYFFNSLFVALTVTVGQLITCSLAAYAFARMEFKGKNLAFALFLSTTMISEQVTLIPSYLLLNELDWLDTYMALTVPFMANAFGVFMLRQAFMTIPRDLEDAAKMDGCGRLRFLVQIIFPLTKPVLAAQALFAFMSNWNSYLWPLIVTTSQNLRTLQVGLRYFVGQEGGTQWGIYMAATVFVSVPVVLFYFLVQKSFIEGIALTGIRG
jgi:multiple sugar transport system permease protein